MDNNNLIEDSIIDRVFLWFFGLVIAGTGIAVFVDAIKIIL
jgi:hypothetical protein